MDENTVKQIAVRLYEDERHWLTSESERRRVPMATIIREAIREKMDRERRPRRKNKGG